MRSYGAITTIDDSGRMHAPASGRVALGWLWSSNGGAPYGGAVHRRAPPHRGVTGRSAPGLDADTACDACSSVSVLDSGTSTIMDHREPHVGDVLLLGKCCQLQHAHAAAVGFSACPTGSHPADATASRPATSLAGAATSLARTSISWDTATCYAAT